ncbi:ubiquitin carboxyl-terminal hydrolase 40-like [Styela clava]
MFGNMFEEPEMEEEKGKASSPAKINGSKVEAPPPGRGETGFCGIKNQGATCYLNSLIQTLLLTPELREELFRLGPDELGKLQDVKKKNAKVRKIPIQLQMLLARLLLLDQYACTTEGLTESFGWVDSEELQQHDVQELSRILFCAIEDSLIGTSGHDIIKNLYRGTSANTITCLSCGKVSENTEDFLDLNIAISSHSNLAAVLRDMFVDTELMNGKNQYRCDQCQKLVDARKGAVIKTLPPILTISLLRFSFDYNTFRRFKETRKFEFPLSLSMKSYCEKTCDEKSACYDYELYSVIIHSGSAHGGHYHAYIRDIDGLGTVPPNYNPTPPKIIPPMPEKSDAAACDYIEDPLDMLAYVLGKLGGENVPMNKLGEAFRDESGTSWGKQYKRKYGTMTKFLQSCYDTFIVDTRTKTVSFRSNIGKSSSEMNNSESPVYPQSCENGAGGDASRQYKSTELVNGVTDTNIEDSGFNGNVVSEPIAIESDTADDTDTHPLCNVWFDFNDSHVKPITTHDIITQYEGRESAYMLFYRRKDLKRPLESLGNLTNGIPDHIRAKIQEENCDLDELRNEYDVYLNVVTVRVFFPKMLKLENGLIKLIDPENKGPNECGFSYSIDRRKNIGDMVEELTQMAEKHQDDTSNKDCEKIQCNIMKILGHGGIHIYEQIDSNLSTPINESLLENGVNVILWDGDKLEGVEVKFGELNEPIVLDVHCRISGDDSLVSFHFKGITFGNVIISELQDYFLQKFKLQTVTQSKLGTKGENDNLVEFKENELGKTLREVTKSFDENLILEISLPNDDMSQNGNKDDDLTLKIVPGEKLEQTLFASRYFDSPDNIFITTAISGTVKVNSYIRVEHLKFSMLHWLLPDFKNDYELDNLHLYIQKSSEDVSDSLKLCLHEKQSLLQAGLSSSVESVRLEIGQPIDKKEYHVTVYIQNGSKLKLPVKKSQAVHAVLNKNCTVNQFIDKIVLEHNLSDGIRHLRILKSEKEAGEILTSPEAVIEKTSIKHGSTLVLCPGGIPSDGQIGIPVWYYPKRSSFEDVLSEIEHGANLSVWNPFLNEIRTQPKLAGSVEVEKDATLFDLKQEIVKLGFFVEKNLIKIEDICLRSISHKFPSRFHLQENSSIKRLRLGSNTPIAVQKTEALPKPECVILNLLFQIPGSRDYTNACELNWEKSHPLARLPAMLSEKLNIPIKELLLAKRGEEPWEWDIIKAKDCDQKSKDAKNKSKKGAKQKKAQGKSNKNKKLSGGKTGQAILSPLDGDLIRVKHISPELQTSESPEVSDFRTEEDLTLRKKHEDSKSRETNGHTPQIEDGNSEASTTSPSSETKKTSKVRKEETLKIHVDKF